MALTKSPYPTVLVILLFLVYHHHQISCLQLKAKSVIGTHRSVVPDYCRNSLDTIQCFEKCVEDPKIQGMMDATHAGRTIFGDDFYLQKSFLEYQDESVKLDVARPGIGYPCRNKCETQPKYWSCMEDCQQKDHTTLWAERCFIPEPRYSQLPNKTTTCVPSNKTAGRYDINGLCLPCLIKATKARFAQSCIFQNLPKNDSKPKEEPLCESLRTCEEGNNMTNSDTPNRAIDNVITNICAHDLDSKLKAKTLKTNEDVQFMRDCVNNLVLVSQRRCCYSGIMRNSTLCKKDDEACDQVCNKVLTPELCRMTCEKYRDPKVQNCTDGCAKQYPTPADPDSVCKHCSGGAPSDEQTDYESVKKHINETCSIKVPPELDCIRKAVLEVPLAPLLFFELNCRSPAYMGRFLAWARRQKGSVVPSKFQASNADWPGTHFTPMECSSGDSWEACKKSVKEERDPEEIGEKCKANLFRSLDMLGCALHLKLQNMSLTTVLEVAQESIKGCNNETAIPIQLKLYRMVFDYEDLLCKTICPDAAWRHPTRVAQIRCRIDKCQMPGKSPYCKPPPVEEDDNIVQLLDFATCKWKVDLAKVEDPFVLWGNYFNELGPSLVDHKLKHPDTTPVLQQTEFHGKDNFYSFPYFVVVRGICEKGYYDDGAYKFFMAGTTPVVEIAYQMATARHFPKAFIRAIFRSALIRLDRHRDDSLLPENPRSINGSNELGCHSKICYPGFAVPQILLQSPRIKVTVNSQETYAKLSQIIYVSPYHSRTVEGKGQIQIANPIHPPHAGMLFPKERSTFAEDDELLYNLGCYSTNNANKDSDDYNNRRCTELEHLLDATEKPYLRNGKPFKPFQPLDAEDFFRSQYTHTTAPVQAIAGFYDPRFMIIGDADMEKFEIVNWGKLLKKLEKNNQLVSCLQHKFQNRGYQKPIYSQMDRTDPQYPMRYYRQRYIARAYNTILSEPEETAIFEAIGLEDRLLLVTSKGVVSFYGHTNDTVTYDKAWTHNETEIVNKCFRIFRILPRAQPFSDSIVGITYDYIVESKKDKGQEGEIQEITQEVWVGKFTMPGQKIEWSEVKSDPLAPMELVETDLNSYNMDPKAQGGKLGNFSVFKEPGLSRELREGNPRSEVDAICYKAFRTKFDVFKPRVQLIDEPGWCFAIDATPLQMQESTIQLLVRMRVTFYKNISPEVRGTEVLKFYFYIIATNANLKKRGTSEEVWEINSVIPRRPCVYNHREAVPNVNHLNEQYFDYGRENIRCVEQTNDLIWSHVYVSGMSYTRTYSNHLFLYGASLLQSTNRGVSFAYLKGFPKEYPKTTDTRQKYLHRIVKMAFDDGGHYVFLTNKRELWLGSTGAEEQIRLRPSPMWSTIQVGISKVKNFNDGIPFNVDYDSQNKLYEMVAVLADDGTVSRIMKRPVNEATLVRVKGFLQKMKEHSVKLAKERAQLGASDKLPAKLQVPLRYNVGDWANVCFYLSPQLEQNFSRTNAITQGMIFPHPEQHLLLGIPHIEGSLMAFQAATFPLMWKTIYNAPLRKYAGMDSDPFKDWVHGRRTEAILSRLKFSQGDPLPEDAILVDPPQYKRLIGVSKRLHVNRHYFLDYNVVCELKFEFSLRNDYQILHPEFEAAQMSKIELSTENANGSVVQINTEKEILADKASVLFIVRMSIKLKSGLKQYPPGIHLFPVPVTFHLINAFGNCVPHRASSIVGDKIETVAMVGCPPSRDFVFDWNRTLASLRFRGDRSNSHVEHGTGVNCHKGEFVCFFSRSPLVLHFSVFDQSRQIFKPYTGNYVMRIIGGGRSREHMRNYTSEEIEAHNMPGVSDVSLIWNEWDPDNHQKVDQKPEAVYDNRGNAIKRDSREVILQSGNSTIMWACHTLSPCARVAPTSTLEVVFWFKIFITNRDVEQNTLCLFEKEFDIQLYGFPPSPEIQLFSTLGFSFLLLSILYILFLCCRKEQRIWLHVKGTLKNWFLIVKDAIPKKLRFYEPPLPEEAHEKEAAKKHRESQTQENDGSGRNSDTSGEGDSGGDNNTSKRLKSSSSLDSGSNPRLSSKQILPETSTRVPTLKEKVYDQILNKRLKSIVEKNRQMRTNLLKKASVQLDPADMEVEEHFQKQFGRTVSQESLFAPPMPKDSRKRGLNYFL